MTGMTEKHAKFKAGVLLLLIVNYIDAGIC